MHGRISARMNDFKFERQSCAEMKKNCPYIVRCNECEFVSDIYLDESLALNERDFHGIEPCTQSPSAPVFGSMEPGDGADGRGTQVKNIW